MIEVNEYFGGNVKSLGFEERDGKASVGVMIPGEYEFSTSTREVMTVISGELIVKLPGSKEWKSFTTGSVFKVADNEKFQLKVERDTAYLCQYS